MYALCTRIDCRRFEVFTMATISRLEALAEAARQSIKIADEDREARDNEIEEADAVDHMPIRRIAAACGMSPSAVHKIVTARIARRQARL